ncbi:hypothetical protein TrST_g5859 [Triparma strigata]|uniref:Dynein heavy chain linker domain-containing protein n=1 Tax=Triparma strigata TaxID=1606541 RepID=A0A9W7B464_9STRA|nr:hypothetical protein TrST_g5859 [Triparma strigata]
MVKKPTPVEAKLKQAQITLPGPVDSILKKPVAKRKVRLGVSGTTADLPLNSSSSPKVSGPCVTISDIIKQCANSNIARNAANDNSNFLIDEGTYAELWGRACVWIRKKLMISSSTSSSSSHQISLLSIGTASHRTFNLGIKIPTFELSQKFALKHNLVQQKSISQTRPTKSSSSVKFNVKEIIDSKWRAEGVNEEKLSFATESLANRIGSALATGKHVRIDFGVGVLVGMNNCVTFEFTQRPDFTEGGVMSPRTRRVKEGHENYKEKIVSSLKEDLGKMPLEKKGDPKLSKRSLTFSQPRDGPHPSLKTDVSISPDALDSWNPRFQSPRKKDKKEEEEQPEYDEAQDPRLEDNFSIKRRGSTLSMFEKLKVNEIMSEIDVSTAPKLLDSYARLQCSTVSGPMASPSDKIGSYFSVEGTNLCLDKNKGKIVWTKGRSKKLDEEDAINEDIFGLGRGPKAAAAEREESEAFPLSPSSSPQTIGGSSVPPPSPKKGPEQQGGEMPLSAMGATRYLFYLNQGAVLEEMITPLDKSLLASLEAKFKDKDEAKIKEFLAEVNDLYLGSVQKATLDYILLNENERERLGIEQVPLDMKTDPYGWGVIQKGAYRSMEWRTKFKNIVQKYQERREIITKPITLVNALWQNFSHLRLVTVPKNYKESLVHQTSQESVVTFEQNQINHLHSVVDEFRTNWLHNLRNVYEESIEVGKFVVNEELMERHTNAMTVVMQNQLRYIVTCSIENLLSFFEMFALDSEGEGEGEEEGRGDIYNRETDAESRTDVSSLEYKRPLAPFIVDLSVNNASNQFFDEPPVKLTTSKEQVVGRVLNIFDTAVHCFDKFETLHGLARGGKTKLVKILSRNDKFIVKARARIIQIVEENIDKSQDALKVYNQYSYLMYENNNISGEIEHLDDIHDIIEKYEGSISELGNLPTTLPLCLIKLTCTSLHNTFVKMAERKIRLALDHVVSECMSVNHVTAKAARALWSKLNKKPTNTDELIEAENFLQQVKNLEMPKLEREVQVVRGQVAFLFKHKNLHGDTLDSVNATFRQLNELKDQYERATNIVHAERMTFEASCRDSKKTLLAQMGKIEDLVGEFNYKADLKGQTQKYLEELDSLTNQMEIVKIKVAAINKEENKLGWVISEFKQILTIEDMMDPFKDLWNIALTFRSEYASWTRSPIFNLDGNEVGKTHGAMAEKMASLKEILEDNEAAGPSGVAKQILDKLNSFSMYIPLIQALTNTRMTDIHWKEISDILGFEISPEDGTINWTNLMAQGALSQENIDKIALLDASANKDHDLVIFREYLDEMEVDSFMFKIILGVDRDHPWAVGGKCLVVDVENMTKVTARVKKHLGQISQISENANGEEFTERCEAYKTLFSMTERVGTILLETADLWKSLVHSSGHSKEEMHQIDLSDEKWRELLDELGGTEGELEMEKDPSQVGVKKQLISGLGFAELETFNDLEDRIAEIRDIFKAVKEGEDTRKLMRRMSRRQSSRTMMGQGVAQRKGQD